VERKLLDEAKKYSIERYAFGKPIGSFQALKHKMADMYVKNELASLMLIMEHGH
jgi:alkylation response protein AidB-like acyl-CoA dehydrogenase